MKKYKLIFFYKFNNNFNICYKFFVEIKIEKF